MAVQVTDLRLLIRLCPEHIFYPEKITNRKNYPNYLIPYWLLYICWLPIHSAIAAPYERNESGSRRIRDAKSCGCFHIQSCKFFVFPPFKFRVDTQFYCKPVDMIVTSLFVKHRKSKCESEHTREWLWQELSASFHPSFVVGVIFYFCGPGPYL